MFTVNILKEVEKMRTVWSLTFLKPLQRFFLCLLRFLIASIIVGVRDYRSTLSKITDQFDKTLLIHWSNAFTYLITFYL